MAINSLRSATSYASTSRRSSVHGVVLSLVFFASQGGLVLKDHQVSLLMMSIATDVKVVGSAEQIRYDAA